MSIDIVQSLLLRYYVVVQPEFFEVLLLPLRLLFKLYLDQLSQYLSRLLTPHLAVCKTKELSNILLYYPAFSVPHNALLRPMVTVADFTGDTDNGQAPQLDEFLDIIHISLKVFFNAGSSPEGTTIGGIP